MHVESTQLMARTSKPIAVNVGRDVAVSERDHTLIDDSDLDPTMVGVKFDDVKDVHPSPFYRS